MFKVTPLFPLPLGQFILEEDLDDLYKDIISSSHFPPRVESFHSLTTGSSSNNNRVLHAHPDLKKIIEDRFDQFMMDTHRMPGSNFKMTTSWVTKTSKGMRSYSHSHSNSSFSGVLYMTDDVNQAPISFTSPLRFFETVKIPPPEYTIWNSMVWTVPVNKNHLIFFPSYVEHQIDLSTSEIDRYSVAFNFFPSGNFDYEDSSINLTVH